MQGSRGDRVASSVRLECIVCVALCASVLTACYASHGAPVPSADAGGGSDADGTHPIPPGDEPAPCVGEDRPLSRARVSEITGQCRDRASPGTGELRSFVIDPSGAALLQYQLEGGSFCEVVLPAFEGPLVPYHGVQIHAVVESDPREPAAPAVATFAARLFVTLPFGRPGRSPTPSALLGLAVLRDDRDMIIAVDESEAVVVAPVRTGCERAARVRWSGGVIDIPLGESRVLPDIGAVRYQLEIAVARDEAVPDALAIRWFGMNANFERRVERAD
jgi:hypothetical protein